MSMPSFNYEDAVPLAAGGTLTSAARTTTQTGADIINDTNTSSLAVVLDVTANAGGLGSVTVLIEGKDKTSGKYFTLLSGAAVTTVSTNRYTVGPWINSVANVNAQTYIPTLFRISVTADNANPVTYSVGYVLTKG